MKLINSHTITGQIGILTGLHIGAGKDAIEIGGIDSPVVKNPYTGEPYIPGSSLKGKLRCLRNGPLGGWKETARLGKEAARPIHRN